MDHRLILQRIRVWLRPLAARIDPLIARMQRDRQWGYRTLALAIGATLILDYSLYATCGFRGCPDPMRLVAYQPGGASVLLDRTGQKFADLAPVQREIVKLSSLPDFVPAAFVAVEDKRFYEHNGVDWVRVLGAAFRNMAAGEIDQGSSTITMQLSRNVFSDRLKASDKSLRRKLFEARVAKQIERRFNKEEILELYLNHIYFGGGAYGIQSAARYYFEKPASKLRLHEAALIAALPKAPAHYNPRTKPDRSRARRDMILGLMAEQGFISPDSAQNAQERKLGATRDAPGFHGKQPLGAYFVELVRNELEDRVGEDLYTKRLRVYTTLDLNAQKAAEEELTRQLRAVERGAYGGLRGASTYGAYDEWQPEGPGYLQGAVVVMEVGTGDVLALVGGRDFRHSRFNRATLARRQAGSAFKPFVYAAALGAGYPASQPIMDTPVRLASNGAEWEPRNYDNQHYGMLSMRASLAYSRNIPAVRLAAAIGRDDVAELAKATGINAEIKNTPMIALGITEVTPIELTAAFGAFAGMGTRSTPRFVLAVEDENGEIIYRSDVKTEQVISPAVSYVLTDMLGDAVQYGTGTAVRDAGYHGSVAGKTGTTSDGGDAWFVGYTPDLVAGVWVGYDAQRKLPARATGGTVSAPVFGRMMRRIYAERDDPGRFVMPEGIVTRFVDPETGLVLEEGCYPRWGDAQQEIFIAGSEPASSCPRRGGYNVFEAFGEFFEDIFRDDDEPEVEPDVSANGSDDVLGAGKLKKKERGRDGRGRGRGRD